MLRKLTVVNLAVVEKATVDFASGLNVITGETGAGKSVLMGALSLVTGGRADPSVVRDGAQEAEVEADFDGRIIRRTVTREGRSRAWVDDESVTVAELKALGETLVDMHGPRANQRLLEEDYQRETLDAVGGAKIAAVKAAYAESWKTYSRIRGEIDALKAANGSEDEVDLLKFQLGELDGAALCEDDATLAERHAAAAHAEEIVENANVVTDGLGGDDRSVTAMLAALQPKFAAMARHFPAAEAWAAKAEELTLEAEELSRTVADAVSRIDRGEENLDELDRRLTLVNRLLRKYKRTTVGDLIALTEEKRERLGALEHREERLAELAAEFAAAEKDLIAAGAALTEARRTAGSALAKAVTTALRDLGFLKCDFTVALEPAEPGADGCDRVIYMFAPNPGESARALAAIASSGEIARVMLALKTVTTGSEKSGRTLVFDEIDANIGGETGRAVGSKMRKVAAAHQVIAITHLPQSAVFGERHLVVAKRVTGGRTRTEIHEVRDEERVSEIARMLGGEKLTSVARRHAEELLEVPETET